MASGVAGSVAERALVPQATLQGLRIAVLGSIAYPTPPPGYGPWETVAFNIAQGLRKRGADVTLFASGDSSFAGRLEAVVPAAFATDPDLDRDVFSALHIANVFAKRSRFDLIHNNFDWRPLLYALATPEPPIVTTIHGFSSPQILAAYYAAAERSFFCSISDADRDPGLAYLATVHNGIDPASFTYRNERGSYLLFFGRFHEEKGPHRAITVARRAGLPLVLAGIVHDAAYFARRIEPHVDGVNVHFIGEARGRERDRVLGEALGLLQLTTRPERFGLSMIEAMACGTPVIGSNMGSIPEIVTHGVTGFLCKDDDEAVKAAGKLGDIDRSACRRRVERHFTIDCMVEAYIDAYHKALSRRRPTSSSDNVAARASNWWLRPVAFTDQPSIPASAVNGTFAVDLMHDVVGE